MSSLNILYQTVRKISNPTCGLNTANSCESQIKFGLNWAHKWLVSFTFQRLLLSSRCSCWTETRLSSSAVQFAVAHKQPPCVEEHSGDLQFRSLTPPEQWRRGSSPRFARLCALLPTAAERPCHSSGMSTIAAVCTSKFQQDQVTCVLQPTEKKRF